MGECSPHESDRTWTASSHWKILVGKHLTERVVRGLAVRLTGIFGCLEQNSGEGSEDEPP